MAGKVVFEARGDTPGSMAEWEALNTAFNKTWNGNLSLRIDYRRTPEGGWHLTASEPEPQPTPWQLMRAIFRGRA